MRLAEMSAQQAAAAQQQAQRPTEPDVLEKHREVLDPRLVEVVAAERRQFQEALARQQAQFEIQLGKSQLQQAAAANPAMAPYVAEATKLYEQSRASGSRATPDEALMHVLGQAHMKQLQRVAPVAGLPPQAFNAPNAYLPAAPPPATAASFQLPADLESRPLAEQIALMERAGFGNTPI